MRGTSYNRELLMNDIDGQEIYNRLSIAFKNLEAIYYGFEGMRKTIMIYHFKEAFNDIVECLRLLGIDVKKNFKGDNNYV